MMYVFFTFDGDTMPIAYQLQREGNNVLVCQIKDPSIFKKSKTWVTEKEEPEKKKMRLSLYDGMLEKYTVPAMMDYLKRIKQRDQFFIIFGHSALYELSEQVMALGFDKGHFQTKEDYLREQDRDAAKEFVKKNYGGKIKLKEYKEFPNADQAIKFIESSNDIWVAKSDGNMFETIVPDTNDLEMAKMQLVSELRMNAKKDRVILEQKIINCLEFAPQMVWYDGVPVYSMIEIETRMFGAQDIGPQTGGNENVVINTPLDALINEIVFPPSVHELAKKHKGVFMYDAGILSDGTDLYFTEFCGNRHGWGSIFSEMTACAKDGEISNYYESLMRGENPYQHKFGAGLSIYDLYCHDKQPIYLRDDQNFYLMQCRKDEIDGDKVLVNVGYRKFNESPLAYVTATGNLIEEAVGRIYDSLLGLSYKGVYYRPQDDFLSNEYVSSVLRRLEFLEAKKLLEPKNDKDEQVEK